MSLGKYPNAEPIPGYRLIELLGKGGCGEVWKCEVPGGLLKAIKFVYGNLKGMEDDRAAVEEELRAIEHIKSIRHPFLLAMERVECINGELAIVTELADKNLHQLLEEYRRGGRAGVPREQALEYLREAAEVLDVLNLRYGLQHLDIKPRNLFLVFNHVKVGDFGLVNCMAPDEETTKAQLQLGAITPLYASPEIFHGRLSPHCDQYSLAVSYQELITGTLPFTGSTSRELLLLHTTAEPNLDPLPPHDRDVVARALAKDPEQRFPNCTAFVRALAAADKTVISVPAAAVADGQPAQAETDTDWNIGLTERQPLPEAKAKKDVTVGPYRLVKCLETSPLVEYWQAEGPDGRSRLVRYLFGSALHGEKYAESLLRLRSLHHPVLNPIEVVEKRPGRLVIASELIERCLRDLLQQCQARKLRGIPRLELLDLLRPVAEGLDYLYRQHSVQHLGLNPRNLLVQDGRVVVDEYGLVQLIWLPGSQSVSPRSKRYCAPELLRQQISPACDQYSLALIYLEMLTGNLPRLLQDGKPHEAFRLADLPPEDREPLTRALDPEPQRRWPSCGEFIRALEGGGAASQFQEFAADQFRSLIQTAGPSAPVVDREQAAASAAAIRTIVQNLLRSAGGAAATSEEEQPPSFTPDGLTLQHRFTAGLPLGEARLKLDAVCEQCYGQVVHDSGLHYVFRVDLPANFLSQWIGRQPGLQMSVTLTRKHPLTPTPIEVAVEVVALNCNRKRGRELLQDMGMSLLEQVRTVMLVHSEKRVQERLLWPHPVEVRPVLENGALGEPILCRGKDLSISGMGFYLPQQLDTPEVVIGLPIADGSAPVHIPATLVRAKACADGWYEVGALFRLVALRSSAHDLSAAGAAP